jgi:hypothetical protein
MKTLRTYALLAALLCGALAAMSACGASTGASTGGTPSTTSTSLPQATATKTKPTTLPTIDLAFCQHIMSLAEANQIMAPPAPATTIAVAFSGDQGACHYEASPSAVILNIFFEAWGGPIPVPQQDIQAELAQVAGDPNVTVNVATPVSGVGDQAEYLDVTSSGDSFAVTGRVIFVLYGKVIFNCYTVSPPQLKATQSQLQQCAQLVVSRL